MGGSEAATFATIQLSGGQNRAFNGENVRIFEFLRTVSTLFSYSSTKPALCNGPRDVNQYLLCVQLF